MIVRAAQRTETYQRVDVLYRSSDAEPIGLSLSYVLPRGVGKQLWVRVKLENPGHLRNFALRVLHQVGDIQQHWGDMAFDHVERVPGSLPQTKPHHRWVAALGTQFGLGVAGRGLYETRFTAAKLEMTLLRAVGMIADWALFKNEGAQDFGTHVFEYALIPSSPQSPAEHIQLISEEGRKFHSTLCAVQNINYGQLASAPLTCVRDSALQRVVVEEMDAAFLPESQGGEPRWLVSILDGPILGCIAAHCGLW